MSHTPPVPPANQSPFPITEPPHPHHDAPKPKKPKKHRDDADDRLRTGIAAALGIGAVAALVAGIVLVSRQPAPPRQRKPGKKK